MNNVNKSRKSNLFIYFSIWLFMVVLVIGAKIFATNKDTMVSINMFFMLVSGIALMFINFYESHRLTSYIKENYPDKWKQMNQVPVLGTGQNGFKLLKFLNSPENFGDPTVAWLKQNYKNYTYFFGLVLVTYPILFVLTTFI